MSEMKKEHERVEGAKNGQIQSLQAQLAAQTLLVEDMRKAKLEMETKMLAMVEVLCCCFVLFCFVLCRVLCDVL